MRSIFGLATAIAVVTAHSLPSAREWLQALDLVPDLDKLNRALTEPPKLRDVSNLTCDEAVNQLYADALGLSFGAIYYVLVNGWYLGAWGDYDSCTNGDTTFGQFIRVTINGEYD